MSGHIRETAVWSVGMAGLISTSVGAFVLFVMVIIPAVESAVAAMRSLPPVISASIFLLVGSVLLAVAAILTHEDSLRALLLGGEPMEEPRQ